MQNHILNTWKSLLQPWKKSTICTRTLLVATGFTVSVLPVCAGIALQNPPTSATQIISQQPKTLEVTLVSYAVTKEAYSKIIPLFTQKWKQDQKRSENLPR